jgi:hypothetical protein
MASNKKSLKRQRSVEYTAIEFGDAVNRMVISVEVLPTLTLPAILTDIVIDNVLGYLRLPSDLDIAELEANIPIDGLVAQKMHQTQTAYLTCKHWWKCYEQQSILCICSDRIMRLPASLLQQGCFSPGFFSATPKEDRLLNSFNSIIAIALPGDGDTGDGRYSESDPFGACRLLGRVNGNTLMWNDPTDKHQEGTWKMTNAQRNA